MFNDLLAVFLAKVKANIWCLFHPGQCVYVEADKMDVGPEKITFVGACTGSLKDDSLVVHAGFYGNPRWRQIQHR